MLTKKTKKTKKKTLILKVVTGFRFVNALRATKIFSSKKVRGCPTVSQLYSRLKWAWASAATLARPPRDIVFNFIIIFLFIYPVVFYLLVLFSVSEVFVCWRAATSTGTVEWQLCLTGSNTGQSVPQTLASSHLLFNSLTCYNFFRVVVSGHSSWAALGVLCLQSSSGVVYYACFNGVTWPEMGY